MKLDYKDNISAVFGAVRIGNTEKVISFLRFTKKQELYYKETNKDF